MNTQQFGKFIAEQRKAKGYTQKELAGKLGVTDKASRYVNCEPIDRIYWI